nr:MAG TPA: hypothetical protein [Caudoviricetes sp.]
MFVIEVQLTLKRDYCICTSDLVSPVAISVLIKRQTAQIPT